MRTAINGNRHQEGHFDEINRLVSTLLKRGDDVVMAEPFFDYLTANIGGHFGLGIEYIPLSRQPRADLAVSIGGDGAFLKTARWIGNEATPVAGINTGHLGYLSAFTFEREDEIYKGLLAGDVRIENRSLLQVETSGSAVNEALPGHPSVPHILTALNEFAISRGDNPAMLNISAVINGRSSLNYIGDGLIISTPTGSTAYNLSVGGPILDPGLAGWVLSPIAAHSLSMRPLVVSDSATIDIEVTTRAATYHLTADGRSFTLPLETRLRITRAPYPVRLVLQASHTFTDTLRDKLGLGATLHTT